MISKSRSAVAILFLLTNTSLLFGYHELGYQYLCPKPDADHVYKGTTLIIRFESVSPSELTNLSSFVSVKDQSGQMRQGTTKIASDNRTIIFTPEKAYLEGETILVSLAPSFRKEMGVTVEPITYTFTVASSIIREAPEFEEDPESPVLGKADSRPNPIKHQAMTMPNGVSVPSDFPQVAVTINEDPGDGYIFIDNRGNILPPGYRPYNIIFDNSGFPVWYWQTPDERRDFKVQKNGWATMIIRWGWEEFGGSGAGFLAIDEHYNPVKTYYATHGYYTDEHELQVLENGGYLIIGRKDESVDMSQYVPGGQTNVLVQSTCIQEYTTNAELIFEWSAWENQDIRDVQLSSIYSSHIYFSHMNSIDVDEDGNLIISSRELSEVCKINRHSGDFIWRLGGAHNQFTWVNDDELQGFRNQHTARVMGNNVYSVFDNGNMHNPQVSRAVKYKLDTKKMTATLIWQFRDTPDKYSFNMGNAQPLPNGNMLINWARTYYPKVTEVRPDGTKAFEMSFEADFECYRVHRCAWNGMADAPRLEYELSSDNLVLIFNKFGDPDVAYYKIYSGNSPSPSAVFDTSKISMKVISHLPSGQYWFRVTAVNGSGQESAYSNEESVYLNFAEPGQNMVENGDFSNGTSAWTWQLQETGQAAWSVEEGEAHITITDGGPSVYDVQLRQNGIPLTIGNTYIFEFDGRADAPRTIEAKVGQDQSPFTNYSQSTYYSLKPATAHFKWEFEMQDPSDYNARVVFNIGTSQTGVYLDNISLRQKVEQWAYGGDAHSIPGLIQCEEYDFGGEGIAFHDDASKYGDGTFRPPDPVDVGGTSDEGGGYAVGWTDENEWLEYTVDVESGTYDIEYRTASEPGGGILIVILNDDSLCTFNVPATGGWETYTTLVQEGIWIDGGDDLVLRLNITAGSQNLNWIRFTKTTTVVKNNPMPGEYELFQNTPNPFNSDTQIEYCLPSGGQVMIQVVDLLGEKVKTLVDQKQEPGSHQVIWDGTRSDGSAAPSGMYLVRMTAGDFRTVRKILLLK